MKNWRQQQRGHFEADAMRVLSGFRPSLSSNGAPIKGVPLGFGNSATGCPVRRFRNPRTGQIVTFGLDRAAYSRGQIKIIRIN